MTTLADLRDRVEAQLVDTGNAIWTTTVIDEALRQSLALYSAVNPQRLNTTVTLASATREVDISGIAGLTDVLEVWLPYTAASPEYPPNRRSFEHWYDAQVIYLPVGDEPSASDVARVFYGKPQALQDLDGATATTLPPTDESLIVTGASGFAAISRSIDLAEQVTVGRGDAGNIERWGQARIAEFEAGLEDVATRIAATTTNAHVQILPNDRFAGRDGGSGWR